MKHLTSIVASTVILLPGCAPGDPEGYEKLAPRAGQITLSNGFIKASWSVVRDPTGVDSRGTGGACLLVRAADVGGPESCNTGQVPLPPSPGAWQIPGQTMSRWFQYDGPDGKCWVKGWRCNRSPDYIPNGPIRWEVGDGYPANLKPLRLTDSYLPKQVGKVTQWRVVACINGYDSGSKKDNAHCGPKPAGGTWKEVWGDVVSLTRPPDPPPGGLGIGQSGGDASVGSGSPSGVGHTEGATIGSGAPSGIADTEGATVNGQ